MTHLAFLDVPASQWEWLVEKYTKIVNDSTISTRIFTYRKILLIWRSARITRYLYETPCGLDKQLSPWPKDWHSNLCAKYNCYLNRADQTFSD